MRKYSQGKILINVSLFLLFILICGVSHNFIKDIIHLNIESDVDKCNDIFKHNFNNDNDLLNYERAGADKNIMDIDNDCYKLINNKELMIKKELIMIYTFMLFMFVMFMFVINCWIYVEHC